MALNRKQSASSPAERPTLGHRRPWLHRFPLLPHRSIQARLQFSHLLTTLVPLLALGFLLLYRSAATERSVVEQTQTAVARSIALDIASTLDEYDSELLDFGQKVSIDPNQRTLTQAETKNYFYNQHIPGMLDLAVLDMTGQELARVSGEQVYPDRDLINRRVESFYALAQRGLLEQSVLLARDGRRVIQIAVPAKNGINQVRGIVVAQITTEAIEDRLAQVPKDIAYSTFVIDESGTVLLGEAPASLLNSDSLRAWSQQNTQVTTLTASDGQQSTAARVPINQGRWSLVLEQPTEIAFVNLRRNTLVLALVLVATTVLVVLWGIVVGREMTRPILQLRDGVQHLGSGQLGDTIEVAREDELGQLAHEFNSMSERLAESQRAIEQRNQRLSEGLDLARLIQRDLLPQSLPADSAIVAHAVCEPATEIGGDFYNYVALPDGRIRLVIGDASGKGVAAALVMALTTSLVDVHAGQSDSPADLLTRLNAALYPRLTPSHMSVSLLVAEFDPRTQQICAANAGMIAPLIATPDACSYISCFGPPLGVVESVTYLEANHTLTPDQAMVFVSDGIVEARNAANEMWGFYNLERTVCIAADNRAQDIVDQVLYAVRDHVRDTPAADDMTIIATMFRPTREEDALYAPIPLADAYLAPAEPAAGKL